MGDIYGRQGDTLEIPAPTVTGFDLGSVDLYRPNGLQTIMPWGGGELIRRGIAGSGYGTGAGLQISLTAAPTNVINLTGGYGQMGPAGQMGEIGLQGLPGSPGPVGQPGPQGKQGVAGPQGVPGPQGPRGFTGTQGIQGIQGDKGEDGVVDYAKVMDVIRGNGLIRGVHGSSLQVEYDSLLLVGASGTTMVKMSNTLAGFETYVEWLVELWISDSLVNSVAFYQYNARGDGGFTTWFYPWQSFGSRSVIGDNSWNVTVQWRLQYTSGPGSITVSASMDQCDMMAIRIME